MNGVCDFDGYCTSLGNFSGEFCNICKDKFFGSNCDVFCDSYQNCTGHGSCSSEGLCQCENNFYGADCGSCSSGYYGMKCDSFCDDFITCNGNGRCNPYGSCECYDLRTDPFCMDLAPDISTRCFQPLASLCSSHYSVCMVNGNSSACECDIAFYQCMLDAGCARLQLARSLADLCSLNSTQNITKHHPSDDRFMYNFGGSEQYSVVILGLGFGLGDFSVRSTLGLTSCEATLWSSDTLVLCKAFAGSRGSESIAVTLRGLVGTADKAVSFDALQLAAPQSMINRQPGSFFIEFSGHNVSIQVFSPAIRIGSTACELTEWTSITSISCAIPRGGGSSVKIAFTTSAQVSTASEVFSYDKCSVSSPFRSNFVAKSKSSTIRLHGNFELVSTSISARMSHSHTTLTHWHSDSSISCKCSSSVRSSMSLVVSSSLLTATYTETLSYDTVQVDRVRSVVVHRTLNSYILETPSSFNPTDPNDLTILGMMALYRVPFSMPIELMNQSICVNLTATHNNSLPLNAFILMYCKNESHPIPETSFNALKRTNLVQIKTSISATFEASSSVRICQTASIQTVWTSSTALACRVADGVGGSLRFGVTVGEQVGSRTQAVTYSSPRLQSALGQVPPGPAVGGGEVRLQGYGMGVADMSAMGRVWVSSCEGTEWISDSMLMCKQVQGVGKELRVAVTSGSLLGTVGAGAAYAAPSLLYGVCNRAAWETCNVNYTRCVETNNTEDGRCACEVSFADCLGMQGCADHSRMLAFQSTCPQNWTWYSEQVTLSELANASLASNRAGAGRRPAVTILGKDFGIGYTITGRAGVSACEATAWTSDTTVACARASGKGSSMAVAMTVGEQVGTTMTSHSMDPAEISSGRSANVAGSGSIWIWVAGTGLGIWDLSGKGKLGGSGSEATSWISESAISCHLVTGTRASRMLSISMMQAGSSLSEAVSYDGPVVNLSAIACTLLETAVQGFTWSVGLMNQSVREASWNSTISSGGVQKDSYVDMMITNFTNTSNLTNLTRIPITVFRWSDGLDTSSTLRAGSSACEASMWASSTALACRVADGVGGSLRFG
eukprot:766128-Hanusia_phi.AAC.1